MSLSGAQGSAVHGWDDSPLVAGLPLSSGEDQGVLVPSGLDGAVLSANPKLCLLRLRGLGGQVSQPLESRSELLLDAESLSLGQPIPPAFGGTLVDEADV